ncbi:MAG: LysR family transcriptional regulator [Kofleriaceae bacterium]
MQNLDAPLPDLELLRCFALLHRERHLSRAAAKAGLSQPAMSRVLGKLRDVFGDPLFVRTPNGMLPTTRADAIAPRITDIVAATSELVHPAAFDPAQLVRTFTIVTAGFYEAQLLPVLVKELAAEAPGVTLSVRAMSGTGVVQLEHGADALVTIKAGLPRDAKCVAIHDESYACALRPKHPVKKLTLDRYCELGHVMVSPGESGGGIVDNLLAQVGRTRHVAVRVHTFALAPAIVAATDLVITGPRYSLQATGLEVHACPIEIPQFPVYLAWHPRVDSDPASTWFRKKLLAAIRRRC